MRLDSPLLWSGFSVHRLDNHHSVIFRRMIKKKQTLFPQADDFRALKINPHSSFLVQGGLKEHIVQVGPVILKVVSANHVLEGDKNRNMTSFNVKHE